MPVTSIAIGVPIGPLAGPVSRTVMSRWNAVWVSRRSARWTTMSCWKPKSSGATKLAASRPAASVFTVAMR